MYLRVIIDKYSLSSLFIFFYPSSFPPFFLLFSFFASVLPSPQSMEKLPKSLIYIEYLERGTIRLIFILHPLGFSDDLRRAELAIDKTYVLLAR